MLTKEGVLAAVRVVLSVRWGLRNGFFIARYCDVEASVQEMWHGNSVKNKEPPSEVKLEDMSFEMGDAVSLWIWEFLYLEEPEC